jgi:hypothetical protein
MITARISWATLIKVFLLLLLQGGMLAFRSLCTGWVAEFALKRLCVGVRTSKTEETDINHHKV